MTAKFVLYLAVLPSYRQACLDVLEEHFGDDIAFYAGDKHLVETVRTGVTSDRLQKVRNVPLLGSRLLLQLGYLRAALNAQSLVTDLNPRSLTSWMLLITRRLLGRRTLLWGHMYPRAGASARTLPLRNRMRSLADGFIAYDYTSQRTLQASEPDRSCWVAANALYRRDVITPAVGSTPPDSVLYVGRIVSDKKVDLLVDAYIASDLADQGIRLVFVGDGPDKEALKLRITGTGHEEDILFQPAAYDQETLRGYYSTALCTVSPGYAGLSITQSLGFGVPILVADDEDHAPEIELADQGGVRFFRANDVTSLADNLSALQPPSPEERESLSMHVRNSYSAERMAQGIIDALIEKTGSQISE